MKHILAWLSPESLVSRVYLLYSATWLLFICCGLVVFYQSQFARHMEDVQQSGAMLVDVMGQTITDSAIIGDYDTIQRTLNKSVAHSPFASASFVDLDGASINGESHSARTEKAPGWLISRVSARLREIDLNLSAGGKNYGVLSLEFDTGAVAYGLWSVIRAALLMAAASMLGGMLMIWYPLRRWLGHLQFHSLSGPQTGDGPPEEISQELIDNAPREFRQTLLKLRATTLRLSRELSEREQALVALRRIVAGLLPASESGPENEDDLDQVIHTIANLVEEREAVTRQMREAKEAADAANRAKGEFLANMSHEIRTPMNGIMGMIDLTLDSPLADEQREHLRVAKRSADSLLVIINDILDFSKIDAGRLSLESIPVDIRNLLEESFSSARVAAENKSLDCNLVLSDNLPEWLLGDPVRLRQVVGNLLSNAFKFTESGAVTLSACLLPLGGGAAMLQIKVRDTGIGIPPDKQDSVFDAFSQEDASTTRRFGGTGLGLSICHRLAGLMGGYIDLESKQGEGSCFIFTFPARKTTSPAAQQGADKPSGPDSTEYSLDVLVAEDNATNQRLVLALLKSLGCRTTLACNGIEAVELWRKQHYDIVFMDMHMPEMGGVEATRQIRETEARQQRKPVPIHALTAAAMAEDQQRCLDAGMNGYLTKPISRNALQATLKACRDELQSS